MLKLKKKLFLATCCLAGAGILTAGDYFFKFAMTPYNKQPDSKEILGTDALFSQKNWFKKFPKEDWLIKTPNSLKLFASYLDHHTAKSVILLHGFMADGDSMAGFAKLFYDLGYKVLLPDARAHGKSQGNYIGYGWVEKADILQWINEIIARIGQSSKIVVMGQSMGGATAMMVSGMKLPVQVKAFIEDCGYSNVKEEVLYQAANLVNLKPAAGKCLVSLVSEINRIKNGFFLGQASCVQQLKKNTRPFLFIHGGKDHFVPTKMVYQNYAATTAPKKLWIAPLAGHAMSLPMYYTEYQRQVDAFLAKYVD